MAARAFPSHLCIFLTGFAWAMAPLEAFPAQRRLLCTHDSHTKTSCCALPEPSPTRCEYGPSVLSTGAPQGLYQIHVPSHLGLLFPPSRRQIDQRHEISISPLPRQTEHCLPTPIHSTHSSSTPPNQRLKTSPPSLPLSFQAQTTYLETRHRS